MSAENPLSTPQNPRAIDPADALELALDVRNLLRFHGNLGIDGYLARQVLDTVLQSRSGRVTKEAPAAPKAMSGKPDREPLPVAQPGEGARLLSRLTGEIESCRLCPLSGTRNCVVTGQGTAGARIMVVGDWPLRDATSPAAIFGAEEDAMLCKMMEAIGLAAEQVFITNALKCSPRRAGEIQTEWAASCSVHLRLELGAVRPRVVLAMGELAAGQLLQVEQSPARLRGAFHPCRLPGYEQLPVLVTYHPRFLLQHPEMKRAAWQDLQLLAKRLREPAAAASSSSKNRR